VNQRLWPPGFLETYFRLFGVPDQDDKFWELVEAYELMCEALYFGVGERGDIPEIRRSTNEGGYFFGDASLLGPKTKADRYLAAATSGLRRWSEARARTRSGGPRSAPAGGGAVARAGGQGH
jgi:hypothetical protein